jgi:ATP-dependent HslUV protease subunit HslV
MLRQLEALLIVADKTTSLLISGTGDLISPEEGVLAVGSGGAFALASARALLKHRSDMTAADIARESLQIAASIDIYTNDRITLEEI